jgi:GlpG protein
MRKLGQFRSREEAQLLSDFLYLHGIQNTVEEEEDDANEPALLWVHDDDQLPAAQGHLERFRANPQDPAFQEVDKKAAQIRKKERNSEAGGKSAVATHERLAYERDYTATGWVSIGVGVLALAVTLYAEFGENREATVQLFLSRFRFSPFTFLPEIFSGEVWRLITPMLLHLSILHLVFNLGWLYRLGSQVEGRLGGLYLGVLILATQAGTTAAQYLFSGPSFGGLSGVNFGLFGFIWMRARFDRWKQWDMPQQDVQLMLVWFVVCCTGIVGPVANFGHAGGLAVGIALGWVAAKYLSKKQL